MAQVLTASTDDRVGRVLDGRYRLVALLGVGGTARVYLADDQRLRRRVAVKVLHAGLAHDAPFLRRFQAEAHAAAALDHPHVLAVHDWGEDADGPFLVTEYLPGGSLRAILDDHGPLSPSQTVRIGIEASAALSAAHRAGLVHRDIKPANLLFDGRGAVRVADFGLVQALSESALTEPDGVVGTARYLPPEAGSARSLDGRADVYALGLVMAECLTGVVPLVGTDAAATVLRRRREGVEVPDVFGPLGRTLTGVLRPDPDARPSAAALAKTLIADTPAYHAPRPLPRPVPVTGEGAGREPSPTRAGASPAAQDRRPPRSDAPRPRRWPRRLAVALAVLVLAAAAAVVAYLLVDDPPPPPVVDDYTERSIDVLEEAARLNGWVLRTGGETHPTLEEGLVIATDPPAGADLEAGEIIEAVVSVGRPQADVPPLVGVPEPDARAAVEESGLVVGTVEPAFNEEVEAGIVVRVLVAGSEVAGPLSVDEGSPVDLVVSAGPAPRVVPDVEGDSLEVAQAAADGLGLTLAQTDPEFSEAVAAGRVISQQPPAGTELARGEAIVVTLSQGPDRRAVPDLVGLTPAEARAELESVGLALGSVFGDDGRVFQYGSGQEADSRHPPGTGIDVFVR